MSGLKKESVNDIATELRQSTKTYTRTNCNIYIYTLLPPDDGLLIGPKHVEVW
jgi:hypothetical protein